VRAPGLPQTGCCCSARALTQHCRSSAWAQQLPRPALLLRLLRLLRLLLLLLLLGMQRQACQQLLACCCCRLLQRQRQAMLTAA
jgi:hypothetical protein